MYMSGQAVKFQTEVVHYSDGCIQMAHAGVVSSTEENPGANTGTGDESAISFRLSEESS